MLSRRELLRFAAVGWISALRSGTGFTLPARALSRSATVGKPKISALRKTFIGEIICPDDSAYDAARIIASFNLFTDRYPQIIARCAEERDIVRAIEFSREHALEVAVRAGGFDVLGASTCDGMVIDLSGLKQIVVNRQLATARVQAGVRSAELSSAAELQGLVAALGCHPSIGITGLTLGGGLGWLAGKCGASCDNVIRANVVTADGKVLEASADKNSDLFWAIKGGGGNFGIISQLELRLHPLDQVFGGVAAYRSDFAAFLRLYRDFMKEAPAELTVELNIRQLGKPTILATACWSGNPAEAERVLRPLREFGPPVADAMRVVSLNHLIDRPGPDFGRRLFGDGITPPPAAVPKGGRWHDYWRGGSLEQLSDEAAAQIASALSDAPQGWSIGLGHYFHGRVIQISHLESCLPRKAGQLTYFFDVGWWDPALAEAAMGWVNKCHAAMQPYSSSATYINYLSSNNLTDVRASYGENYGKLAALKRKYDPYNFFHLNRNIVPA